MKTKNTLLLVAALGAAGAGVAQTIEFVVVDRQVNYVQTVAGSAALDGAAPYEFVVNMSGTNLGAPFTLSIKRPDNTSYAGYEHTAGTEWQAPTYPIGNFASMALLHGTFPDGVYTIQASGFADVTLSIPNLIGSPNDGFANTPFVIGTQDSNPVTWFGGKMLVDPTKELTLTSTTFTTNYAAGTGRIGLWVDGGGSEVTNESAPNSFYFSGTSVQMQIAANTLSAGTYTAGMEFNNIVSSLIDLSGTYGSGANGVSVYTAFTTFQIQAVPEPSTYAAVCGALALTGAAIYRRRRRAA
jgi:hypothetical protein